MNGLHLQCTRVSLYNMYIKIIALLFLAFEEAEKNAPAIIFIDELDAIAPKRDKVCICGHSVLRVICIAIDTRRG